MSEKSWPCDGLELVMELLTKEQAERLNNEYELVHLIYYRSKNQHRLLVWWKYLNIIHRKLRFIIKLLIDIERCKKEEVIRYKQSQVVDTCNYLVTLVLKKAYYEFNCIITLGQFIKLGFVLVGLSSRIFDILVNVKGVDSKGVEIKQEVVIDTNDDLGEEIVEDEVIVTKQEEITKEAIKRPIEDIDAINPKKKKKEKKKKKKSVMDDIFG